jgi:hypothetical protein
MVTKEFNLKKREFVRRKLTTLQHKLKTLMKCYTISDFILNEQNDTFVFKKSHKINGIKMNDSKQYKGRFEAEEIENETIKLKIFVD